MNATEAHGRPWKDLWKDLGKGLGQCIAEHHLIDDGDRIMVCLSGGKDSYTLLQLLRRLQTRAPISFELVAVHLDQAQPGYDGTPLARWLEQEGVVHHIVREDTYSIVKDRVAEGKTYCSLCSRLRRGVLYNLAEDLGCTKIALGHHRDDAIETLLLNMFFAGSMGAMPAKLETKDGRNTVIRPMLYLAEKDIAQLAELERYPILPCNLCGSQENLQRQEMKRLLNDLETRIPQVRESLLASLKHVRPSHLLDERLQYSSVLRDKSPATSTGRGPVKLPVVSGAPAERGDVVGSYS